jgi:hypothetical protein
MRTVREWRDEIARTSEIAETAEAMPGFREMLDTWIAQGHADRGVKVILVDEEHTGFELAGPEVEGPAETR